MPRSTSQHKIDRFFKTTPLAYQPGLVRVFGATTGLFLYQLLYWNAKENNRQGWIYKKVEECRNETGLSRSNQETAVRALLKLGVIEYKRAQVPAKRHFRIDMKRLEELIPSLMEKNGLVYLKPPEQLVKTQRSSSHDSSELLHETTQEITTLNKGSDKISAFRRRKQHLVEKMDASR